MNLTDGFYYHATATPNRVAFVLDNQSLTYAQLLEATESWQQHVLWLANGGTSESRHRDTPPPRIAWHGPNHVNLAALYLACARLGFILVVFDSDWPDDICAEVQRRTNSLAVVSPRHAPETIGCGESDLRSAVDTTDLRDHAFLIGFTSGSTGGPKAFLRNQQSWLATFERSATEFGSLTAKHVLAPGPLSHGLSFYAMAETLNAGGTFQTQTRFDAVACMQTLRVGNVHSLVVVPTMLTAMLEQSPPVNTPNPAKIITAGAKLSVGLRSKLDRQFPETRVYEYYGASELSFVTISAADEQPPAESVGRACAGVTLTIRNTAGAEMPSGVNGLVCVDSDMLAQGYLADDGSLQPLVTVGKQATVADIGWLDDNGFLYLTDRAANGLISGGLNVYPAVVEQVLERYPGVTEAIVVGVDDEYWGDKLCAVVRMNPADDYRIDLSAMKTFCRQYLGHHEVPRSLFQINHWPSTSSGKLNRSTIHQWLVAGDERIRELK